MVEPTPMRSRPWELRGWPAPAGKGWALEPPCRHREGPKWSRGESKEREPSGVWRWKAASVWCLGSAGWVGFPGKEAENKDHISPCGQAHGPVLKTTNMNCDCFYPSISATWSRKQAAPGHKEETTGFIVNLYFPSRDPPRLQ